jgi:DNA-binding NarL/FixJ family response regulator
MEGHRDDSRLRLLLVTDHRGAGDALAAHLSRHGFDVVARACTPGEAAEAVRTVGVDVALVDGDVACGWRAVVQAVAEPLGRHRVAVLSAYWGQQERSDARRCGIGAAILKAASGAALAGQLRALAA